MATDQDVTEVETIHHQLDAKALLPAEHLVHGASMSADVLVESQQDYGLCARTRVGKRGMKKRLTRSNSRLIWENEAVTCPNDKQSRYWKPATGPRGKPTIQVHFDKKDCAACTVRALCTRSCLSPSELTLHPQAQHIALQAARERQKADTFQKTYAGRAGVEGTVSQAVFALDMRRIRYRGLAKTHFQHIATEAAINLQRFTNWVLDRPRSEIYRSPCAWLAPAY